MDHYRYCEKRKQIGARIFYLSLSQHSWSISCFIPKAYSKAPKKGRKKGLSRERETRSILLMLDLKTDELYDSGKEDEGKTFHVLQLLGMNEDLWDKVRGLGTWI